MKQGGSGTGSNRKYRGYPGMASESEILDRKRRGLRVEIRHSRALREKLDGIPPN